MPRWGKRFQNKPAAAFDQRPAPLRSGGGGVCVSEDRSAARYAGGLVHCPKFVLFGVRERGWFAKATAETFAEGLQLQQRHGGRLLPYGQGAPTDPENVRPVNVALRPLVLPFPL